MIKALKLISAATNVIALLKSTKAYFKETPLSPLLFVISLILLTLVLRWMKQEYSFQNGKINLNHLLFMDDLKLYGSNQNEVDSYVGIAEIITTDIRMKFGIN